MAMTLDKAVTKRVAQSLGVMTPRYAIAFDRHLEDVLSLRFPLIVKPVREEASIGVTLGSVVHDLDALNDRVKQVLQLYRLDL